MPNKVALHRTDTDELLGLMAYIVDGRSLAVEIVYVESADHSNANLLHAEERSKKYIGIAKALFAHVVSISIENGYDGVLVFKAKTGECVRSWLDHISTTDRCGNNGDSTLRKFRKSFDSE